MNPQHLANLLPPEPNGCPPLGVFCAVETGAGEIGIGSVTALGLILVISHDSTGSAVAQHVSPTTIRRHAPLPNVAPLLEYLQASCPPDEYGHEPEHEAETVVDRAIRVLRFRRADYQEGQRRIARLGRCLRAIRNSCNAMLAEGPTVSAFDEREKAPEDAP